MLRAPIVLLALAATVPCASAEGNLTAQEVEFFEKKIRPVLAESCYQCHNSVDKKKGDLALDYRAPILEAEVIVPGNPEASPLIKAIRHAEENRGGTPPRTPPFLHFEALLQCIRVYCSSRFHESY